MKATGRRNKKPIRYGSFGIQKYRHIFQALGSASEAGLSTEQHDLHFRPRDQAVPGQVFGMSGYLAPSAINWARGVSDLLLCNRIA